MDERFTELEARVTKADQGQAGVFSKICYSDAFLYVRKIFLVFAYLIFLQTASSLDFP